MDIPPIGLGLPDLADTPSSQTVSTTGDIVRTIAQGRQQAAAAGLSFARQSLETALAGANLLTLFGGDGKSVLLQAQSAMSAADSQVKTLRNGIVADAAQSNTSFDAAAQQLDGLSLTVSSIGTLAESIIASPATARPPAAPGRGRQVATIRALQHDMAATVAGGTAALIDVTI